MANTWIVAADSSRARVLQVSDRDRKLVEIDDLTNPAGRMDDRELTTDATPRFGRPGSDREEPSAREHETELFAKRVGEYLDHARTEHRYDELVILAPPKFLGLIRKKLGKQVEKLVTDQVPKNLAWIDARELERYLEPGH